MPAEPRTPRFLFLLSPPYSGSTVMWRLLQTSPHVSGMPTEGQFCPELADVMRSRPWDPDRQLPWPEIRRVWERYWNLDRPVLLEKSPPNLLHAAAIERHFEPAWFVVMMREPYSVCEGLHRRSQIDFEVGARQWLVAAEAQLRNAAERERALWLRYEDLVADPAGAAGKVLEFLPELESLRPHDHFSAHEHEGPIVDFNARKIARLSAEDRDRITAVLRTRPDLLERCGYELLA